MLSLLAGTEGVEVLPPTAAGRRRGLRWSLVTGPNTAVGGVLLIDQERGERRTYLVTEHVPGIGWDGRLFGCRRVGAARGYTVALHRNGQDDRCDCAAGCYERVGACVHVLALKAVVANGWFPDPFEGVPESEPPTAAELEAMADAFGGES